MTEPDNEKVNLWSGKVAPPEMWWEFDKLPSAVKWLYWHAPFNYTAMPAVDYVARGGRSFTTMIERQTAAMSRELAREAWNMYGPSHPQAVAPQ